MASRDPLSKYYGPSGYVSPERVRELNNYVKVTGLHLIVGGHSEDGKADTITVCLEIGGVWRQIIQEDAWAPTSIIVEPEGIRQAPISPTHECR